MLPRVDDLGRIYAEPAGVPVTWNAGLGYTVAGRLCVTSTLSPLDTYQNGWRRDDKGRLVVANQAANPVFNAGWPVNSTGTPGAVARQFDTVPAAKDPFVAGVRIGAAGGVYMTTDAPP